MLRKINVNGVRWIDGTGLSGEEIKELLSEFNFHELDVEACLEENQSARIDSYPDYFFIILHFPKYIIKTKTYILNEFNIFIGKDFIITLENYGGVHIDRIFEKYKTDNNKEDLEIKFSSGYILYEIIQSMLEKMFIVCSNFRKDTKNIENFVFDNADVDLVKEIMIKKRNIVVLKHMFNPQVDVLKRIELRIKTFFEGEIEVYYEDLDDKLNYIVNNIEILKEYIDSIEDAFKTIIDIKTNFTIKVLALFSAFLLPLTLITSFYGMNVALPLSDKPSFVFLLLLLSSFVMFLIYFISKKNGRF